MFKQAVVAVIGLSAITGTVLAQNFPAKPISIVVGYPAGGSTDVIARLIGQKMSASMGQPVIIENKPGAAGQIGAAAVAKAQPDGYTILFTNMGPNAIAPSLNKSVTYDPVKDFSPIAVAVTMPLAITTAIDSPYKDVASLIAAAKAQPGKLTFGSSGNGGAAHVAGELFKLQAGVDITHVAYKGGAQVGPATMTGEVSISFQAIPDAMSLVKANRLRAIAVTSPKRSPLAPNVPAVAESGLPQFDVNVWYGFLAPARTPKLVIDRLNREIGLALAQRDVTEKITSLSTVPQHSTPEEFQAIIRADVEKWARVIKDARIAQE